MHACSLPVYHSRHRVHDDRLMVQFKPNAVGAKARDVIEDGLLSLVSSGCQNPCHGHWVLSTAVENQLWLYDVHREIQTVCRKNADMGVVQSPFHSRHLSSFLSALVASCKSCSWISVRLPSEEAAVCQWLRTLGRAASYASWTFVPSSHFLDRCASGQWNWHLWKLC